MLNVLLSALNLFFDAVAKVHGDMQNAQCNHFSSGFFFMMQLKFMDTCKMLNEILSTMDFFDAVTKVHGDM